MSEFVYNDPKRPTSGSYRNLEGLSAFALMESGSPMIAIQQEEKALEQYIKDKAAYDEMVRKAQEQFKKQQKARTKSTLIMLVYKLLLLVFLRWEKHRLRVVQKALVANRHLPQLLVMLHVKVYMPSGREFGPYTNMIRPSDIRDTSGGLLDPETGRPYRLNAKRWLNQSFCSRRKKPRQIFPRFMGGEYCQKTFGGQIRSWIVQRSQQWSRTRIRKRHGWRRWRRRWWSTTANNNFEINITMNGGGEGETTTTSNQNENQSQEQQERNEQLDKQSRTPFKQSFSSSSVRVDCCIAKIHLIKPSA